MSLRRLWEPTADKPRPTKGIGLTVVVLGLVIALASQCQRMMDSLEKEPEIELKGVRE